MFTELYLQTTNPQTSLQQFFSPVIFTMILFSTIFHTILYASTFNLASYIFYGKILSSAVNQRLILSLAIIMFLGFFARFLHVKEIYKAYNYNLEKTRAHLDRLYITWIFIS
jgi:uncharacterized membrane protein